jgi:hypothetical protein
VFIPDFGEKEKHGDGSKPLHQQSFHVLYSPDLLKL